MEPSDKLPVILVVDDDALLRWHAAEILAGAGYGVVEADDAKSALRIIEGRPDISVLFTDVQMPGDDDGMTLAAKAHERHPSLLLLVTSGGLDISEQDIADHGRFLPKPYPDQVLLSEIKLLISDRELGRI